MDEGQDDAASTNEVLTSEDVEAKSLAARLNVENARAERQARAAAEAKRTRDSKPFRTIRGAPMKSTRITLRKENANLNMRRQYTISVEQDLFGAPLVVCRWGRIGKAGQRREHVCESTDEARTLAARLVRRRRGRGYRSTKMSRSSQVRRAAAAVTAKFTNFTSKSRYRRRATAAEQLHFWPAAAAKHPAAALSDPAKTKSSASVRTIEREKLRQAKIERVLRDSATRASAHGETLAVQRSSIALNTATIETAPLKWCELREKMIEEAINVPTRGWGTQTQHRRCI